MLGYGPSRAGNRLLSQGGHGGWSRTAHPPYDQMTRWETDMKTATLLLLLLCSAGCAGLTTTTSVNEMWNKEKEALSIDLKLTIGMEISDAVLARLTPEQITAIYTEMAKAGIAPGGQYTYSPHIEFSQSQGTDAQSQAEQSAKLNAELTATVRDIINRSPVPAPVP